MLPEENQEQRMGTFIYTTKTEYSSTDKGNI
jgi:hypothetical protein